MGRFSKFIHNKVFGKRCDQSPCIKYFSHLDFEGLLKEEFSFKNEIGNTLRGGEYYYPNYSEKNTLVLFFHGMGGGHLAYMREIEYLCKQGFRVISYDMNGTIESDGGSLGGFCQILSDANAALKHIKNATKYKGLDIYVVGHSWGGYTAGNILNYHQDIKKCVEISGIISMEDGFNEMVPLKSLRKGLIEFERNKYPKYASSSMIDAFNNNKDCKVLVVHSKDDNRVNFEKNYHRLECEVKNDNVSYYFVENKKHNPTYTSDAVKYLNDTFTKLGKFHSNKKRLEFSKNIDWEKMCELDEEVMNHIVDFLKK